MDRFSRRTVKVTREHNEECRKLLGLMGIPFVVVRFPTLSSVFPVLPPTRCLFSPRLPQKPKRNAPSLHAAARSMQRVRKIWIR